ncbi:MAG: methyltransferase domain-containing protein [Rickettsiaceae bacterium]|nr:methyltransferase domain-containing protein [Rickettsiaceae bacterium]
MYRKIISRILFTLLLICNGVLSSYAAGGGGDSEEVKTTVDLDTKTLYKKIGEGACGHLGGIEATDMVVSKSANIIPEIKRGNSLDIGSGFGGATNYLKESGFRNIWGLDLDEESINYAKGKYPSINFIKANALDIPDIFDEDFFSFVYMFNVACEIPDKVELLQKIKNVTEENGLLAIFDYTALDLKQGDFKNVAGEEMYPLNMQKLKVLLRVIGWEVIEIVDVSDQYIKWCEDLLDTLYTKQELITTVSFSKEELDIIYKHYHHILEMLKQKKLGGVIIFAKKV